MEFKGTKGEWNIDPKISTVIRSYDGRGVANVSVYTSNTATLDIDAENEANAKLIAAAPELLDCVQQLRKFIDDIQTSCAAGEDMLQYLKAKSDAAITKALTI